MNATLPPSFPATISPPVLNHSCTASRALRRGAAGRALDVRVDRIIVGITRCHDAVRASPDRGSVLLRVGQYPEPPLGQSGEQDVRDLLGSHDVVQRRIVALGPGGGGPEPAGPV